ncbi:MULTISPECIES: polyphosphate kinase 1 [Dyadobacter]|uniref:Polyphosphate kinase n=1 Tax=Dyadobacter sediminis TaxID=1493691 RepID=A0A5R9K2Y5_9BACT|nr:polyphosphate kinase 1 [Dyadobacter sediminis]TLU88718.1 polyphosphate kinase 1 [Dyadobacter sediminis]GGC14137.1 polyphosphate kinase [Dyadobacter sediminis]
MNKYAYFDRDISWLSFNERVLMEADNETVPLLERVKFLSIYSANLDEFYRVRMPVMLRHQQQKDNNEYDQANQIIDGQQSRFRSILSQSILPALQKNGINFYYQDEIPQELYQDITEYFYCHVAGLLQPVLLTESLAFFPENDLLYITVILDNGLDTEQIAVVNIPTDHLDRFVSIPKNGEDHIIFLDEVIKQNLKSVFPKASHIDSFNIKINRDAVLDTLDDDADDITEILERQLRKRKYGYATRFLYEPGLPERHLQTLNETFDLSQAAIVQGGKYHNSKDLASLPVRNPSLSYLTWPAARNLYGTDQLISLFDSLAQHDQMVHAPYQSYDRILRFFNEAAIDPQTEEIYTTMYRVAHDSKIALALISAAKNGKKVVVLVELKARFDEANNIRWSKKMKAAGVKIVHSINSIKVHAKLALVKRTHPESPLLGLLATGNLNEGTARFYTDHVLLTAYQPMLKEVKKLFRFLSKKKRPEITDKITFQHLLVAQFNLHTRFLQLIDREIVHAKNGLPSGITIKVNNLEEEVLINRLYEASNAGVKINLIVRSICRLVAGVPGQSENITVKRIVDRYLEHGRIFIFRNNADPEIYMGSADWMNRNIYRRIEVVFPVYNETLKKQLLEMIDLQLEDTLQAVIIDDRLKNITLTGENGIRSQDAIYALLSDKKLYE